MNKKTNNGSTPQMGIGWFKRNSSTITHVSVTDCIFDSSDLGAVWNEIIILFIVGSQIHGIEVFKNNYGHAYVFRCLAKLTNSQAKFVWTSNM